MGLTSVVNDCVPLQFVVVLLLLVLLQAITNKMEIENVIPNIFFMFYGNFFKIED